MSYLAKENRYEKMEYQYCGESGLKLPAVSLGLWHNFGENSIFENMKKMCFSIQKIHVYSRFYLEQ